MSIALAAQGKLLGEVVADASLKALRESGEADIIHFGTAVQLTTSHSPFPLFSKWFAEAQRTETPWANAMNIATVSPDGRPSSRTVLMQMHSEDKGFGFYTNYESRKGAHIRGNQFVALTFYWPQLSRQVRIEGRAMEAASEESDAYFAVRPRGHQSGASN